MSKRFLLAAAFLAGSANLFAQATATGTLIGTVFDSSKAVVPKADVSILSPATGLRRSVTSSDSGSFTFNQLPADVYRVTVKSPGFTTAVYEKVELRVATTQELEVTLSAGAQTDLVTVDAAAPLLDTTKTEVSQSVTPTEVQNLPINGRDFANLAFLAPGAKPVNAYDPTKARIAVFGVNGSAGRNVNVTVNGIDDKDNTVGGPVMQLPLEAVREFNISTQRFSAANGRSEGAALNLITKSGENQLHGSLFLFERDTSLNANDYFSKQTKSPTAPYSRQQYGGSFGAPIIKDKTFAFFAIERQRESSNVVVNGGAYNELLLAAPLGAQAAVNLPTPYADQRYTGRLDHRFNDKHSIFGVYNSQHNKGLNDQATSTNDLTAGNFSTNRLILTSATLNSILTPNTVNSFTFGYQYWNNIIDSDKKVPYIIFPSAQLGTNPNVPQQSYQAKFQFRDDLSINHGKHSYKMGFDFVKLPKLGGFFQTPSTPNITFFDDPSVILNDKLRYPNGFSSPGAIQTITASAGNSYFKTSDAKMLGFYFQDDWKISKRLNVNLGIRWDRDFNLTGGNTQALGRTFQELAAIGSPYAKGVPQDDTHDFSPRVGFAYDTTGTGKYVIRGGYGIYYGQIFQNIPLFAEQQEGATVFSQVLNLNNANPPGQAADPNASLVPGTTIPLSRYRYGVDPFPIIPAPSTQLPGGNNATGRLVNPGYHNPYTQEFNLGFAWALTPNNVITFEGIHTLGLRESKRVNINPLRYQTGKRDYDAAFAAAGQPLLAQIIVESSVGRSRYDAFNITYARRLTKHFTVNSNYVISRALAYAGGPAAFGNVAPDPDHIFARNDYGPAPNDETHRFVFSGSYDLPFGIRVSPIFQAATGRPYNPVQGINVYGTGGGNGAWRAVVPINDRMNYRFTKDYTATQLRAGIADGTLVTIPYDNARGNAFIQLDLRVSKTFTFWEKNHLEVLLQMFDVNNRSNFGNQYNANIRQAAFGKPLNFLSTSGTVIPHAFQAEAGFQYRF